MSCPVNLRALPSGVLEEIFTPENMRGRSTVSSLTPLSFPKSRSALWDGTPAGEMLRLHLCSHRGPQLVLSEKALRLARRHARHSNKPRVLCFFLGSVSVNSDEEGITLTLDRFDPGRDQAGSSVRVPSALLPGDVLVPCWFSFQSEAKPEDAVVQSEAELHHCFKALQQFLCSRQTLDLCQLVKVKGQVSCSQRLDAMGFSLRWSAVCPSVGVDVQSVRAVPIIPTALLRSLTSIGRHHAAGRQRGFLTMDQSRKLLLVLESDPKASSLPLVGLWLSGVTHVYSPVVWAWCLRFLFSASLQDRVFSESGFFLLVIFGSTHRVPQFFQCRGPGPGPGPGPGLQLDYQLLSASQFITLYQVAPVDGQTLQCELGSESQGRQTEVFRDARLSFSSAAATASGPSMSDQDSGVEDEDLSPRPSPSPHPPAQQTRRVQPSVPELSLLIDSSFSTSVQPSSAHRPPLPPSPPPPPTGDVRKTAPPSGATSTTSHAPRPPQHLHSTPNSNLQQPCSCCCSHTCSSIAPSPQPLLQHPAPPQSTLHAAPPPASQNVSPPKPSLHYQTPPPPPPPPPDLHTAPPPPLSSRHQSPPPASAPFSSPLPSILYVADPAVSHHHHPPPSSHHRSSPADLPAPPLPSFLHQTSASPGSNHLTPPPPPPAPSQQLVAPFLIHSPTPPHGLSPSPCPCRALPPPSAPLPRYTDSPSPHPPGLGDVAGPVIPPWLPRPPCGEKKCCDHAPGGAMASDAYLLLLHQDRQLRLLQAQVQMLLETQKKLQSSGQQADSQTSKSTTSIAVETGASLFWGNPVPNVPHQDMRGPPPPPLSSPKPPASPPLDRSVGGAEDVVADQVTPQSTSDPHSLSGLQSPVLGESVSMYQPADQQQSFYQNLMTQLTSRLQESENQQEEPRRTSLSAASDASHSSSSSSSSQSSSSATRRKQRRSPAGDPVVSATLNQLQQLGVQVNQEDLTESDRSRAKAVESASTLASIDPAAAVSRLSVSKPTASVVLSGGSVDLSLEANAIALRYLSDSQLSKLSVGGPAHLHGPTQSGDSLLSPSNMSLATRKYMRRYGLIEEEEEEDDDCSEDEKEKEEVGGQEASTRQPLTDTMNVKLPPQSQLIRELRPKMQLLAGANKENRSGRRPTLIRTSSHETEGSVGNILDLSRLRQLPKLF